ncbi:MAG: rod shape-determining protein, partial [Veillonella sp.]|nr:rod shape-determining protein [Veillonella sp.]
MSSILPTLGKDVSIDIGSIQTRLMGGTRGTVISEPSIIATDTKQEKVVAVGDEAARLVLRMPDMWRPLTPLKDGFIVDYRVMHTMLNYFLNKVSNALRRARVLVGVPCGMTDVEQRAMMDAVIQAGAREVFLIERPVAAAIGCGAPIFEARGSMVIDIGGGT